MRVLAVLCAALAALVASAPPAHADPQQYVMKLGTGTYNDSQHEWLKRFAQYVQADSHGRIIAQVYPAAQLGSVPRMVEELQFGSLQGMTLPLDFMQGVDDRFQLLDAPGLFDTFDHANATLADRAVRGVFLNLARGKGIVGLQMFSEGPVSYVLRKPARTYGDLKGLKIRVLAGAMQRDLMTRLQATGVPLPLDQLGAAVQQGAVDGAQLDIGVGKATGLETSAKYVLYLRDVWPPGMAVFNTAWYDALPPDLRRVVDTDADRATRETRVWAQQYEESSKATWIHDGGQIVELNAAQRAEFLKLVSPVGADVARANPQLQQAWQIIVKAAAAHRPHARP